MLLPGCSCLCVCEDVCDRGFVMYASVFVRVCKYIYVGVCSDYVSVCACLYVRYCLYLPVLCMHCCVCICVGVCGRVWVGEWVLVELNLS